MKKLVAIIGLLFATAVFAQSNIWLTIARSDKMTIDIRPDTHRVSKNDADQSVTMSMFRLVKPAGTTYELNYVRLSDCSRGFGQVVSMDLNGAFKYAGEFVIDGGSTLNDRVAEALCFLAQPSNKAPTRY